VRWGLQLIVPNEPDALPRLLDTGRLVWTTRPSMPIRGFA
jgi:hypothetical protein